MPFIHRGNIVSLPTVGVCSALFRASLRFNFDPVSMSSGRYDYTLLFDYLKK
jgi:hypothetical protein